MTESQKNQIIALRKEGIGYQSIAKMIGTSRDIVRNFCKSRNLAGYGKNIRRNILENIICLYCGKEMEQPTTGRKRKFCCEKCRREWWKMHPENMNKRDKSMYPTVCVHCKKEFISYGNKTRKYCSRECYIQARFWEE